MPTAPVRRLLACALLCLLHAACGQKGPPLAPLHLVPAPVTELTARRVADSVRLRFVLPSANANGPGPVQLDRVEIYAMTLPPGAQTPANRDLLSKTYLVGEVAVRPPPAEGEAPDTAKPPPAEDVRPQPGEAVTFEEELTPAKLTPVLQDTPAPAGSRGRRPGAAGAQPGGIPAPQPGPPDPLPGIPASSTVPVSDAPAAGPASPVPPGGPSTPAVAPAMPPASAPAPGKPAAAVPVSTDPVRVYVARGVTKGGRSGAPSARVQVPIVPVPPPPPKVSARVTETAVVIEWQPPADSPATSFNVYRAEAPMQPVNSSPVTAPSFEYTAVQFGESYCFSVRSVRVVANVPLEGAPSEEECITPRDVFPPAAPQRLDAVPTPGQISLIWEGNTEKDLAGYIVLRGDAPDGVLQPLTPAPIRETSYRDGTVTPGVRYIYAVVAVDTSVPPNTSAQSPRVEETAR